MTRNQHSIAILSTIACLPVATGCVESWRPPLNGVQVVSATVRAELASRMTPPGTVLVYSCRAGGKQDDCDQYVVELANGRRAEGRLVGCKRDPLEGYLQREPSDEGVSNFPWPPCNETGALGFFLEFEPPLVYWPSYVEGGRAITSSSRFHLYGARGPHVCSGNVTRSVELEGYESVEVGEQRYSDALRLRVETSIRVPWLCNVRISEYVWLAPGVGEVRRMQKWKGRILLITSFDSLRIYDLMEAKRPQSLSGNSGEGGHTGLSEAWRLCAIHLYPGMPVPRLSGLIAETDEAKHCENQKH